MQFTVSGQQVLGGKIQVSGAKNAVLKFMAASLLSEEAWTIENVPDIADVSVMVQILEHLGATVRRDDAHTYTIEAKDVNTTTIPADLSAKLRTSILCVAPLLARFGEVTFSHPGGCVLGKRPIDLFLDGYRALGAEITESGDSFHVSRKKNVPPRFVFPFVSHMATESLILGSVFTPGQTTIVNAAMEPEVEALTNWLNSIGAKITNGGHHTITIEGVKKLSGGRTRILPDRIETGTFAVLGSLIADDLLIEDCEPKHLDTFWEVLRRAGGNFEIGENSVRIKRSDDLCATNLQTREYPGFTTDLQAPFTVLLTQARGLSLVHEVIYEGRLFYTDSLNKMGAKIIMADPHRVIVEGPTQLVGKKLESPDIRAGIALVIAALIAQGESTIDHVNHIDRGYERIDERLRLIGAKIERHD